MRNLIKSPSLEVSTQSGTEGPRHDPYHFTEYHATVRGVEVVLHEGLAEWIEVNGRKPATGRNPRDEFAWLVGYTPEQLEMFASRLASSKFRAHKAHGGFRAERGYPGETMTVCKCGECLDYSFNEDAVM